MAFPANPTDGQIFNNYKYNVTKGAWEKFIKIEDPNSLTPIGAVDKINDKLIIYDYSESINKSVSPDEITDFLSIEIRASDPPAPTAGQIWVRSDL